MDGVNGITGAYAMVLSVGHFALGYVADSNFGSYRMCGCVKRD